MTTEERVLRTVEIQLGMPRGQVNITDRFVDDLGADSLDTAEILMALEEEFDIEIDESDITQSFTVEQAINRIDAEVRLSK